MEKERKSHEQDKSDEEDKSEDMKEEKAEAQKKEEKKTEKKTETKAHKTHTKTVRIKRRKKKSPMWPYVLGLILIIAIVAVAINFDRFFPGQEPVEVAAIVNGQVIPLSTIDQQYNLLPAEMKAQVTKDVILNKTIDEVLLLQEAQKKGIIVEDSDVEDLLSSYMAQSSITREMLDEQLKQSNMTYDDLKEVYMKQITITRLLNQTVISQIEVSDQEIADYYQNNMDSDLVVIQPQVRARHILVKTEEEAQDILARLEAGESFTDLAKELSLDPGSAQLGGDLGYFYEGQMVPEFNDAAFSMDVNSTPMIVETQFGFHVIEVTGKKEGGSRTLEEASEMIKQALIQEKQNEAILAYIKQLRDDANIVIKMGDTKVVVEGLETFSQTGDPICTEDGKPIIRVFTTSTCPHCRWIKDTVDEVLKSYGDEIVAHHWVIDTKDDLLTEGIDGAIPDTEMQAYMTYDQQGYVPFFLFGCKYMRIGNGYEQQGDLELEKQELRNAIDSLLNEPRVTIN